MSLKKVMRSWKAENIRKRFPLQQQSLHIRILSVWQKKMEEKYEGLKVHTYCIRNDFFGERITVSGLITGQALMKQLKDQPLGSRLLDPCNMLKIGSEDIFLDDFTLKEVSDTLQVPIDIVKSSGQDLIDAILGVAGPNPTDIDENQMKDRRITTA